MMPAGISRRTYRRAFAYPGLGSALFTELPTETVWENSWRSLHRGLLVAQGGDKGASRPFSDSWDRRVELIRIYQTVSQGKFSETPIHPLGCIYVRTGAKGRCRAR
jgi:hypothetical protein